MLPKDREARKKLIIADYQSGMRITDVAGKHEFAVSNISRILKEAGVWVRGRDGNRKRNMLKKAKTKGSPQFTLSGLHIKPYIRALYDPKNIITTECLSHTVTFRGQYD